MMIVLSGVYSIIQLSSVTCIYLCDPFDRYIYYLVACALMPLRGIVGQLEDALFRFPLFVSERRYLLSPTYPLIQSLTVRQTPFFTDLLKRSAAKHNHFNIQDGIKTCILSKIHQVRFFPQPKFIPECCASHIKAKISIATL